MVLATLSVIYICSMAYGYQPQDVNSIFLDDIGGKPFVVASADFTPEQQEELFSIINSMDPLNANDNERLAYIGFRAESFAKAQSIPLDKKKYYAKLAAKCIAKLAIAGDPFGTGMCLFLRKNNADKFLDLTYDSTMSLQARHKLIESLLENYLLSYKREVGLWGTKKH